MVKHGASHGLAYLICTISAGLIVYVLHRFVPSWLKALDGISSWLISSLGISFLTREEVDALLLAAILAVLWGMAFKRRYVN